MNTRPKIAVNTRFLIKDKLEGIGLFTYETLKHITTTHPDIDFYFLFDRPYSNEFIFGTNVMPVVLFPPARHPLLWYWWFEISVSGWLNKHRPDLFLSPDGYACLSSPVKQVLVIHDIAYEHFTEHIPFVARKYYQYFIPRFAKKAARIATVSNYSKTDIEQHYGISPGKIDVVYNGAKEVYKPAGNDVKEQVKQRLTAGVDYFVYVGSIHPRKNVGRLLSAFELFKTNTNAPLKLVIVGRMAWNFKDVQTVYDRMNYKHDVIFTGHLSPDELGTVVASATAMVYVSLFEGFGIPIIEAMNCGVPVITSNTTSMPEAAGDAALLVDPTNVNEIAYAMQQIANDTQLQYSLAQKGLAQAKKFSWQLTAEKLFYTCSAAITSTFNNGL